MKTSDLTGTALDWAVCVAVYGYGADYKTNRYSTDWSVAGPIIEREGIELRYWGLHSIPWKASIDGDTDAGVVLYEEHGTTPLIAAMRCYVASKLGDEVEIPKELTE